MNANDTMHKYSIRNTKATKSAKFLIKNPLSIKELTNQK